jgi:hypothetical protein
VHRLLNIIETNQQVMANSRCSHANTFDPNPRIHFHSICAAGQHSTGNSLQHTKNGKQEERQKSFNSSKE